MCNNPLLNKVFGGKKRTSLSSIMGLPQYNHYIRVYGIKRNIIGSKVKILTRYDLIDTPGYSDYIGGALYIGKRDKRKICG